MKVAALQMTSGPDVAANLASAGALLEEAATAGARLAALPENFAFIGLSDGDKRRIADEDDLPVAPPSRLGDRPFHQGGADAAIAADRIDGEGKASVTARDRLLFEVNADRHVRVGGDRGTEFGDVGFRHYRCEQSVLDGVLGENVTEGGRDHATDAVALSGERLLLEPADRQHLAGERDLAGHRHIRPDQPPGQE